ncbi:MAG: hypothetical protein HYT86_05915 [candidate division NC10 bacterium]|nr:hypothetical protein [candidate division NC10 bacterium]
MTAPPEQVHALLDALRGLEAGAPALEEGLARLFALGASTALKRAPASAVVPLLVAFLRAADAPVLGKGLALVALEHHGLDTNDPALFSATLDLRAIWQAQGRRPAEPGGSAREGR